MNKEEIETKLTRIAFKQSRAFCMGCYTDCPKNHCPKCGSDDLARKTSENVDWGTSWIIEEILAREIQAVDLDEAFEDFMSEVYPEPVAVGFLTLDVVSTIKEVDPIAWRCAQSEWESNEESEENMISFDGGSTYYNRYDLEEYLDASE